MSQVTVFVHIHGKNALHEAHLKLPLDGRSLRESLEKAGIDFSADSLIFLDEDDDPTDLTARLQELKAGTRVHISTCRRVQVTVNFLDKTITNQFPPGTRVKRVKEWAAKSLEVRPTDAAEHVLQLCGSQTRPAADTPLNELTDRCGCSVCFEFVPDKRVEG